MAHSMGSFLLVMMNPLKLIAGPNENHPFLEDFVALQGRHVRGIDPDRSVVFGPKFAFPFLNRTTAGP